jgi:general secretion pathway protein D
MKLKLLLMATLLLMSASQILPQDATPVPPVTVGALNLQNASLREVIDQLARLLKINIIVDDKVAGSVTLNTYGAPNGLDARNLLELLLRINGAGMVQEGEIYHIVPINQLVRQPISQVGDPANIPDDDRTMLNLVFLKFVTVDEVTKILSEFSDDRTIIKSYAPANLLFIMDSRRNMRHLMDLIAMFDSDTFNGERIRLFDIQNTLPSSLLKDLDKVLKAISLDDNTSTVRFLPVDRIGKLIAVAPNPGVFDRVQTWIQKLDVPITSTSTVIDTYIYRVNYGRADCLAQALNQLFNPGAQIGMGVSGYGGNGGFNGGQSYPVGGQFGNQSFGNNNSGGGLGGNNANYGSQNAFNSGFGGAGACGPYSQGNGMGNPYANTQQYANPSFGGYAAQTPVAAVQPGGMIGAAAAPPPTATAPIAQVVPAETTSPPRIVAMPLDNSLMIQANAQQYQSILKLLRELDKPPRQILLEAKTYQVVMSGSFAAGVTASFEQRSGANRRLLGSVVGATTSLQAGVLVGQARQLLAFLQLQENASNARVISEPSLIATDSIPASLNVGAQIPVLTGTIANLSGSNTVTQQGISARNTGVTLQVNARVNPSGVVTLIINHEVSKQSGSGSTAIPTPSFDQQTVQTQVTVQDGDTIAFAGIISEDNTTSSQGIPGLNRIPKVGFLFGQQARSHSRTELVLFITPHVIYDTNDLLEASEQVKNQMKKLRKYIVE